MVEMPFIAVPVSTKPAFAAFIAVVVKSSAFVASMPAEIELRMDSVTSVAAVCVAFEIF